MISSANVDAPAHRRSPGPPPRHTTGDMLHHRGEASLFHTINHNLVSKVFPNNMQVQNDDCQTTGRATQPCAFRDSQSPQSLADPASRRWPLQHTSKIIPRARDRSLLSTRKALRGSLCAWGRVEFLLLVMPSSASRWTWGLLLTFALEGS